MKKKLLAIAVLVICLSIISAGTWAVFTAEGRATNVITTGSVEIVVHETTTDANGEPMDWPDGGISGVMPGSSVDKNVVINNTGTGDAWVRVWVNVGISEPGDPISNPTIKNLPLTITKDDGSVVDVVSYDVESGWTQGEDGYWYYNSAVDAGGATTEFIKKVSFAKEMGNEYQSCVVRIDIFAEAVQVANNGTSAMTAKGWPEN